MKTQGTLLDYDAGSSTHLGNDISQRVPSRLTRVASRVQSQVVQECDEGGPVKYEFCDEFNDMNGKGAVNKLTNPVGTMPKQLSYVDDWRKKVAPIEIGIPCSPFSSFEFPASPVAVITPDKLQITSLPPYDPRTASYLARYPKTGPEAESSSRFIIKSARFYDLDDPELEQMINELEASSVASSSTISATVYIPPVEIMESERPFPKSSRRNLLSALFWFPVRIKYSLLPNSNAFHKVLRRPHRNQ